MLKRIIKWLENRRSRKQADYRATALAVKLVITGALTSSNRGVTIVPLKRKGEFTC
ncbi:MAG: hypothetical protein HXX17_16565 [Geobacteraceae bacterium]|nr:hypothetical protein [Geobacteraceae bacterium]